MIYLAGIAYVIGLILLFMPTADSTTEGSGTNYLRLGKHVFALILFAGGVMEIQERLPEQAGSSFIVVNSILILIIGIFHLWRNTTDGKD